MSLRDVSTANIAAEEMGGASETATPSMSRQSSVTNSTTSSDTPTHSHTTLPQLYITTPGENSSNHVSMETYVNGEIPSSGASPIIHELKHSNNNSTTVSNLSSTPKSNDVVILEIEREKLCAALDEKVCSL